MTRKAKIVEIVSICEGCEKIEEFSFRGCANICQKFIAHTKKVAQKGRSPCYDFRCGVPGAGPLNCAVREDCPLPAIYHDSLEEGNLKCVLDQSLCHSKLIPLSLLDGRY